MEHTTTTAAEGVQQIGPPNFTPQLVEFFNTFSFGVSLGGAFDVLGTIWSVYAILAFLFSGLFVFGYLYASQRSAQLAAALKEGIEMQEQLFRKHSGREAKNSRWQEVLGHVESGNPNDWRLAIIEADIMLDDALKQLGYAGTSLGERLRSITPSQLSSIDDAWQAHKVRNEIAHAGADFVLTQRLARDTINQFQRVFQELGVI